MVDSLFGEIMAASGDDVVVIGARVILACRNESSALRAREEITAETGNSDVHFRLLDLASLASVRRFADQFLQRKMLLHFLTSFLTQAYSLWQLASLSK